MTDAGTDRLIAALRTVLPADHRHPLHEPRFAGREWDYVKDCLDSGWVSSVGAYVDRFERDLAAYVGVRHAVATVNGTAALHVALQLAGVRAGDEVLVPTLTFIATANAVSYCGAIPHFVDSDLPTLGVDADKLAAHLAAIAERRGGDCLNRRTGRRLAGVVVMHAFGHPADMDAIRAAVEPYGLPVIEDAAEALGSSYKGRMAGGLGLIAALSFNGNKIVTTGGGGAILTDDPALAARAKHLTTTAKRPHPWAFDHDEIGYNYRLPNINAALGCAQLEELPDFLAAKRALADRYREALAGVEGVALVDEPAGTRSNYWLTAILLAEASADRRDAVLARLTEAGIMARPAWTPMHQLPIYATCPRMDLATAESIQRRLINLPSSAALGMADG